MPKKFFINFKTEKKKSIKRTGRQPTLHNIHKNKIEKLNQLQFSSGNFELKIYKNGRVLKKKKKKNQIFIKQQIKV